MFSRHVRSLAAEREPGGDEMGEVWAALRRGLRRELRRRGLWQCSPAVLGIVGHGVWQTAHRDRPAGGVAARDALDELATDAYVHVFVERSRALAAQLRLKPNVDGLVRRNLRFFVHERQRRHDPLGLRVYRLLARAVCEACARGRLFGLPSAGKVRNATVLGFGPSAASAAAPPCDPRLARLVRPWAEQLLPELMTARGAEQERVVALLARLVAELADAGVERFRFKALIDPLKAELRAQWARRLEDVVPCLHEVPSAASVSMSSGEKRPMPAEPALDDPGHLAVEHVDRFRDLAERVEATLVELPVARRHTRGQLLQLWHFLRLFAHGRTPAVAGAAAELPSNRELSRLLGIPRDRFPGLLATVRDTVDLCRGRSREM